MANRPSFQERAATANPRRPLNLSLPPENPNPSEEPNRAPTLEQLEEIRAADEREPARSSIDPAPLDDALAAAEPSIVEPGPDGPQLVATKPSGIMQREPWIDFWLSAHDFAGSMPIIASEALAHTSTRPNARAASGALYDAIVKVPSLHFLLREEADWLKAFFMVGGFYQGLLKEIIAERRAKITRSTRPGAAPMPVNVEAANAAKAQSAA